MKTLLLGIIFISLILFGSIFVYDYIENSALELTATIERVETLVKSDQWTDSEKEFDRFKKKWEPSAKIWMSIIGHEEIDNIEKSLIESENYIKEKDKESLVELALLKYYLAHISLKEKVNLQNIF